MRETIETHVTKSGKGKITIDLKQKKLDPQMKDSPNISADSMIAILSDIYDRSIKNAVAVDPLDELKEDKAKLTNVRIHCEVRWKYLSVYFSRT